MITEFRFDEGAGVLVPAYPSPLNRLVPCKLAPSLTLTRGTALARLTTTGLFTPYVTSGSNGTGTFAGFLQYTCATDASSNVYLGGSAASNYFSVPSQYMEMYAGGIFNPLDLQTAATPTAEVDTWTVSGTIAIGDTYTLTITYPGNSTYAVSYAATAATVANVTAGLAAAWNADTTANQYATATSTSTTVVLTSAVAGNTMNVAETNTGSGSASKTVTTAAAGRAISDVITGVPGAHVDTATGFWVVTG